MHSLSWSPDAWNEYVNMQRKELKLLKKINTIIKDIQRNGYHATIGKPEMLKHDFSGYASVRIDKKHRLIFTIEEETIVIVRCGGHYND